MRSGAAIATGSLLATVVAGQVVQWDIEKRQTDSSLPKVGRRASTQSTVVQNRLSLGGYFATTSVGTPPQNLTIQLDTGSSDIWVPSSTSSVCSSSSSSSSGCTLGSFKYTSSSTFKDVGKNKFDISYVDGSHSTGDYFTDTFTIGGATVTNMTMGLGLDTDIPYGLVGVGYALNEAIVSDTSSASAAYANLPVQMMNEGLIATNAYSLWLNDLDASTGSILFGGIDTEKYKGDLTRLNVYKDSETGAFTSFIVALTSMQAVSSSGSDSLTSRQFPIPVVLDSGTTLSYLPTDLATEIWKEAGAVYSASNQAALIPCSMQNSGGYFSFGFGGVKGAVINVTMDELVLDLSTSGQAPTFTSGTYKGQEACQFGIQNFSTDPFLLGDTFLRSAYVVYDLINNQIALAPTDFNATASNVVPFASSGAPIPSATAAPSQAAITASAAGSAVTTPAYGASPGFTSGIKSAASLPPAFDWTKVAVMGTSVALMMVGSGVFLLL